MTTVGAFTYDEATGDVTGPATYMRERFPEVAREIEAGRNVVFNHGASGLSPDVGTALLVAIHGTPHRVEGASAVPCRVVRL